MKVFDCFLYFDEDFLLNVRLNILNKYVDYFVIVEGNKTWQNNYKNYNFNINKFNQFREKIIYLKVDKFPDSPNPWIRENYQRNYILKGLNIAKSHDLIIISDLDEIPNPKKITSFKAKDRFAVFKQKLFYYKFNLQNKTHPNWLGSRICVKKYLKSPQWLRNLKFKKRPFWRFDKLRLNNIIENGGWHFCNLKNSEQILYKYKNLCETDDQFFTKSKISEKYLNLAEINRRILSGKDIIGRNHDFEKISLNEDFPEYILQNKKKFSEWIL